MLVRHETCLSQLSIIHLGWCVARKLEGANILEFVQKPKTSDIYLGFASMFIAEPEILEYSGQSLEGNVFPVLAQKELLRGYLSTNKIVKIHSKEDLKSIKQQDL